MIQYGIAREHTLPYPWHCSLYCYDGHLLKSGNSWQLNTERPRDLSSALYLPCMIQVDEFDVLTNVVMHHILTAFLL